MITQLLGHEKLLSNSQLFLTRVTRNLYDLEAISQRAGNGAPVVGRGQKRNLRQIKRHIDVVVDEGVILSGIEYFQ